MTRTSNEQYTSFKTKINTEVWKHTAMWNHDTILNFSFVASQQVIT
jgi:hypothetical protein